jgi:hypothetical protein
VLAGSVHRVGLAKVNLIRCHQANACRATIKLRKRVNQDEKPCALAA